ncbi:hypothetical protein QAD02_005013 [Eretmocerus hayati]|uniref:Uncharacterized protein n=1 Tax=Eretmocerus hayati TaxID=131215 RepID=A0ACC2NT21_9HYME|nr:hypothetical protein QAD02_005013 [Eretmocerus hayati]
MGVEAKLHQVIVPRERPAAAKPKHRASKQRLSKREDASDQSGGGGCDGVRWSSRGCERSCVRESLLLHREARFGWVVGCDLDLTESLSSVERGDEIFGHSLECQSRAQPWCQRYASVRLNLLYISSLAHCIVQIEIRCSDVE